MPRRSSHLKVRVLICLDKSVKLAEPSAAMATSTAISSSAAAATSTSAASSDQPESWQLFYITWGTSHASFRLPELRRSLHVLSACLSHKPLLTTAPSHLILPDLLVSLATSLIESIAKLLNIPFRLAPFGSEAAPAAHAQPFADVCGLTGDRPWDVEGRPVCPVALRSSEDARRLCGRMVSVKYVPKRSVLLNAAIHG